MLTWKDYQVAEARRKELMEAAAAQQHRRQIQVNEAYLAQATRWVSLRLGGWLVEVGLRLQSSSVGVAGSLRSASPQPVRPVIKQAEQNC
ncbi:MAG: hypothetical protein ACLFWD_00040 [Anaerolineales bacterium]